MGVLGSLIIIFVFLAVLKIGFIEKKDRLEFFIGYLERYEQALPNLSFEEMKGLEKKRIHLEKRMIEEIYKLIK